MTGLQGIEQEANHSPQSLSLFSGKAWPWLVLFAFVYTALVVPHWNLGHLDFGDGNYMYISWRMSQGAVLYRDILAPQPPMHLLVGAAIARIGTLLPLPHPLYAFRAFSLMLHLATMVLLYRVALRITDGPEAGISSRRARLAGLIACAVYLLLPIGFWWTLGYQSQPLLVFFLMLTFYLQLKGCVACSVASGITGALAALTNMTTAPYLLLLAGYNLVRRPRLLLPFVLPLALIIAMVIIGAELYTHAYLDNVIRNQVGAFPRKELLPPGENALTYALSKLYREGTEVLRLEAGYLVLACLGLAVYAQRAPVPVRGLTVLFTLASFGAIVYVAKGGTVNYVFSVSEPYVALMVGYFVAAVAHAWWPRWRATQVSDFSPLAGGVAVVLAVFCVTWVGLQHSWRTLKQDTYELPEAETLRIVDQIKSNCPQDGVTLAPPFYAFLAQRRIAADYSELLLWKLKYMNETVDREHGRAHEIIAKLAAMIREKRISFMALDMDQTYMIPEIKEAVDANYAPQLEKPFRTLNTPIMFYKPK
ncbi:MAG: ArnT family glycosyltransferase [Candidatus Sumerlaeaceae bacterium]